MSQDNSRWLRPLPKTAFPKEEADASEADTFAGWAQLSGIRVHFSHNVYEHEMPWSAYQAGHRTLNEYLDVYGFNRFTHGWTEHGAVLAWCSAYGIDIPEKYDDVIPAIIKAEIAAAGERS